MPNLITENSSISGYIESLFSKHLENASGLSVVSGNPLLDGYFSNTHRNANSTILDDATGVSARFYLDTYNNTSTRGSSYRGRRFRGSQDYPSGIHFNDNILHFSADGYDGTEVISASAIMAFVAAENWTSGKNGTYFRVGLTPSGQTGRIDRLLIKDGGNVGLSNSNPLYTLDVSGSGNFTQGIYWNGVAVNTGIDSSTFSSSANLTQTGQVLDNKINSLSGNNYSSLKVTGSTAISAPNFSGIGTTQVFKSGDFVLISGAPAGAGAGEANTISSLGGGISIYNTKVGVDLRLNSISGGTGISTTLLGGNTISVNLKPQPFCLPFNVNSQVWTNMPAAMNFFGGTTSPIQLVNLAGYTGVSLTIAKGATAGAANSFLQLRYLTSYNTTSTNYLELNSPGIRSSIDRVNVFVNSGYRSIVGGANAEVYVALVGSGGNGALDPAVGCVTAHFM